MRTVSLALRRLLTTAPVAALGAALLWYAHTSGHLSLTKALVLGGLAVAWLAGICIFIALARTAGRYDADRGQEQHFRLIEGGRHG